MPEPAALPTELTPAAAAHSKWRCYKLRLEGETPNVVPPLRKGRRRIRATAHARHQLNFG